MMKKLVGSLLVLSMILLPMAAMADKGQVVTGKDYEITMFGALRALPQFMGNLDFDKRENNGAGAANNDLVLDENGWMKDHAVRTEARVGWRAAGKDWDFLLILEADFSLNKVNVDRQTGTNNAIGNGANTAQAFNTNGVEANSDTFGIEKINFGYEFCPFAKINVGWNTKFVDLMTGGLIYADDHPYIGLAGKIDKLVNWEILYLTIQDDVFKKANGFYDGDNLDWRAYTARIGFNVQGFTIAPIYAYSDNEMRSADVHYMGIEGYGNVGIFTPRFEYVYALGTKDVGAVEYDIKAQAAYASLDIAIMKEFVPYFGGYWMTGDDDNFDTDVKAYNGIAMNQRNTPTFGIDSALVYRFVPSLGSFIYESGFQNLGGANGYGGSSNGQSMCAPGLYMLGLGIKGQVIEKFEYKLQYMNFWFENHKALEQVLGNTLDSNRVGAEWDLSLTWKFSPNFSLGNVLSIFEPGTATKDRLALGTNDRMAWMNTVELTWNY